jgi:hypothetical protein
VGDFNVPLLPIDNPNKTNMETSELNGTVDQMDVTEGYRIFHLPVIEYTFFLVHRIFSKIDYILQEKPSIFKYRKIK